jgi:hypothetical protein
MRLCGAMGRISSPYGAGRPGTATKKIFQLYDYIGLLQPGTTNAIAQSELFPLTQHFSHYLN